MVKNQFLSPIWSSKSQQKEALPCPLRPQHFGSTFYIWASTFLVQSSSLSKWSKKFQRICKDGDSKFQYYLKKTETKLIYLIQMNVFVFVFVCFLKSLQWKTDWTQGKRDSFTCWASAWDRMALAASNGLTTSILAGLLRASAGAELSGDTMKHGLSMIVICVSKGTSCMHLEQERW